MKRIIIFLIVLLTITSVVPAFSQSPARSGNITITEHQVDPFTVIKVGGAFNVILQKGEAQKVRVETDENLHPKIHIDVADNVLSIRSAGMRSPTKLNVYVTYTSLESVDGSGAANISSNEPVESDKFSIDLSGAASVDLEFKTNHLTTSLSGASNARLSGEATLHESATSGASQLQAGSLITQVTNISLSGASSGYIKTTDTTKYDITGAATLTYTEKDETAKADATGRIDEIITDPVKTDSLSTREINVTTEEKGDTIRIRLGSININVHDSDTDTLAVNNDRIQIEVEQNIEMKEEENDKERFNGHWAGIYLGINGYTTAIPNLNMPPGYDFLDLRYYKSINFQLNLLEQNLNLIDNKLGLVTGLGLEWNNYRFGNNIRFDHTKPTLEGFADTSKNFTKSKMVVRWLNLPLMIEFQSNQGRNNNKFHIAAGVVGGVRIGSHTKMVAENGGNEVDKTYERFHLSPLKADATVRLGWGIFNLYANYSLTSLFVRDKAPGLYPFSMGLNLIAF
ncbi:MAG TPA: DUF2807 domain-containing protein [Bacteroidales bacterium]|nr:DUF2807 domain-containing protein [Bacteroidales bacterium]